VSIDFFGYYPIPNHIDKNHTKMQTSTRPARPPKTSSEESPPLPPRKPTLPAKPSIDSVSSQTNSTAVSTGYKPAVPPRPSIAKSQSMNSLSSHRSKESVDSPDTGSPPPESAALRKVPPPPKKPSLNASIQAASSYAVGGGVSTSPLQGNTQDGAFTPSGTTQPLTGAGPSYIPSSDKDQGKGGMKNLFNNIVSSMQGEESCWNCSKDDV
jgi:hypothetical protein